MKKIYIFMLKVLTKIKNYFFCKKYTRKIKNNKLKIYEPANTNKEKQNIAWFFWNTGIENAPKLVKKCLDSLKNNTKYLVNVVSDENIENYIHIPDLITKKYKNGNMCTANYSDIVRSILLIEYGGLWSDSTVFFSQNIPEDVLNSELFVFKNEHHDKKIITASSWFICAKPNNDILKLTLSILIDWWSSHKKTADYFMFHWAFTIASKMYYSTVDKMPYYDNLKPHMLQVESKKRRIDITEVRTILKQCFCHKLSIHNLSDTYDYFLKTFLNC